VVFVRGWLVASPYCFSARGPTMIAMFKKFVSNQNGATAIEYGLIAALIAVVIIGALTTVGSNLNTDFTSVASSLR
jgi:pilus assembly protein Flp/PilA